MPFEEELRKYLPGDLPHRGRVIELEARHLMLIEETNRVMNLTRIVDAREAVIKHVCDSVQPWHLFGGAKTIVDAGAGPGFPGLPLSLVFPDQRFILCESIQKKAHFVASAVKVLEIPNVTVEAVRVEEWLRRNRTDIVTARAMAPISKIIGLLKAGVRNGSRVLLYKGPDIENEIAAGRKEAEAAGISITVVQSYKLPEGFGERTMVELKRKT